MNKKFLSLVLALVMVLGAFTSVFAADAVDTKEVPKLTSNDAKIQWLVDNEIVIGRKVNENAEDNDLALKETIQRAEVTKLLVYAIGKADLAEKLFGLVNPYSDVAKDYWANGYITVGTTSVADNGLAFLNGYPDGTFKPMNNVTYAELAKMLVVIADDELTQAQHDAYNANWPTAWVVKATEMGIFEGVTNVNANDDVIRSNGFVMMYNAFYAMEDLKVVNINETIGVISENSKDLSLVLNQGDFKKEFKVDTNTVFVGQDAASLEPWLANKEVKSNLLVGSLVRVIANADGVVTHIVELGNKDGVKNFDNTKTAGWLGLAEGVLDQVSTPLTVNADSTPKTVAGINITSATRFFVSDYDANALTEVKDFDAAYEMIKGLDAKDRTGYVGYDVLPKGNVKEAKVVVFTNVKGTADNEKLVRVLPNAVTKDFNLPVNLPNSVAANAERVDLSLAKLTDKYPIARQFDVNDVLEVTYNANKEFKSSKTVIDSSERNVYQVLELKTQKVDGYPTSPAGRVNAMVISDGVQKVEVALPTDLDVFFGDQLVVGAKIQLNSKAKVAQVVSVLPADTKVKGFLADEGFTNLETIGLQKGVLKSYTKVDNNVAKYELQVSIDGSPVTTTLHTNEAFGDKGVAVDDEITFMVENLNGVRLATHIEKAK